MKRTVALQRPPLVAAPLVSAERSVVDLNERANLQQLEELDYVLVSHANAAVLRPKSFHDRLESMSKADNGHVRATAIEIRTEGG